VLNGRWVDASRYGQVWEPRIPPRCWCILTWRSPCRPYAGVYKLGSSAYRFGDGFRLGLWWKPAKRGRLNGMNWLVGLALGLAAFLFSRRIMDQTRTQLVFRVLGGALVGSACGLVVEWLYAQNWPPIPSFPYPVFGPVCWGLACSLLCLIVGSARFRGVHRTLDFAFVCGIVAGALVGGTVYATIRTEFSGVHDPFRGKVWGFYLRQGVFFGAPLGGGFGLLMGSLLVKRPNSKVGPTASSESAKPGADSP
jgi:hypothetical protein